MSCWEQFRKFPFTLWKKPLRPHMDYRDDIYGGVFEDRFESMLIPNLPKRRKGVIVTDNAKCHSRIIEKTLTVNMKNDEMIAYMSKYDIEMYSPIPAKPVLLKMFVRKYCRSLVLWLKKLAVLIYGCLRIIAY